MTFEDLGIRTKLGARKYATICPECNDKRQKHKGALCLTVNDEPGNRWYNCNHCGWSGNLDIQDKYKEVSKEAKMPDVQKQRFSIQTREYLQQCGISLDIAKEYHLYEQTKFGKPILCFPYYQSHTLVNVKYLNFLRKEDDKYPKWTQMKRELGTKAIPFGINKIKTHDSEGNPIKPLTVIITEGEKDMLTWRSLNYKNVISTPQGAPSVKAKNFDKEFEYLHDKYVKSILDQVDMFILSADNDEAGRKLAEHLGMILGKEKCRLVKYPKGYKDINEVYMGDKKKGLKALGEEGVKNCYDKLRSFPIKGIIRLSQVYDDLQKIREDGFEPGLSIGVEEVDQLFTLKSPLVAFVTGIPSSGKSTWIRWYLVELIKNNIDLGIKIAMFTPENRPVAREYAKIAEALTGQPLNKSMRNAMSDAQIEKTMRWIQKHVYIIAPDKYNYESFNGQVKNGGHNTIDSIQQYLIYLKKTENIFCYVIDAWNKIEHEQPRHQTETQFISQQLDRLIDFNKYWDMAGIVIVHPKKIEQTSDGNYKMPSLYDIKGSSAWYEKADYGIVVHRYKARRLSDDEIVERGGNPSTIDNDERWEINYKAPTIIRTEKIKFEETGKEDRIKMEMVGYGRFKIVPPSLDESSLSKRQKAIPPPPMPEQSDFFDKLSEENGETPPF